MAAQPDARLVRRDGDSAPTIVPVGLGHSVGGPELIVIAGPCSAETRDQVRRTAEAVKAAGAHLLRGGAFKPRTSPYAFQGLGEAGLQILREAADEFALGLVSEVMDVTQVDLVTRYVDVLQVGARNMQNYGLLRALGARRSPVILKRGAGATVDEWLLAAEYILAGGNTNVILCERGIRTFETGTRNTLDLSAVPAVRHLTHLPVIVDPSHGTGRSHLVVPMAMAATAAGADGLMVEVHCDPDRALSDGDQSIHPHEFAALMRSLDRLVPAIGRRLAQPSAAATLTSR